MTKEELNSLVLKNYEKLGIPTSVAEKMLSNDRNPAFSGAVKTQGIPQQITPSSNFTLGEPKKKTTAESIANAAAINRGKKEDILSALNAFLRELDYAIDVNTVQDGKAGAIMFKNKTGDYFTLKLTLNKSKPADFIE